MNELKAEDIAHLFGVSQNTATAMMRRNNVRMVKRGRWDKTAVYNLYNELEERKKIKQPVWVDQGGKHT